MRSGRTLWDEFGHQRGVDWVVAAREDWAGLAGAVAASSRVPPVPSATKL